MKKMGMRITQLSGFTQSKMFTTSEVARTNVTEGVQEWQSSTHSTGWITDASSRMLNIGPPLRRAGGLHLLRSAWATTVSMCTFCLSCGHLCHDFHHFSSFYSKSQTLTLFLPFISSYLILLFFILSSQVT